MSGILLTQQQILLPRLIAGAWTSRGSGGILGANVFIQPTGNLQGFSTFAGTVSFNRWMPFQTNFNAGDRFQVRLTYHGPTGSCTDSGVWRDIGFIQWDLLNAQAAPSTHVVTMTIDIRLKDSTSILATALYTLTYEFT